MDIDDFNRQTYYPTQVHDNILDDNLPEYQQCETARRPREVSSTLGNLDVLPLEVLQEIIPHLDLYTINSLRCVNSRSLSVVESVPEYKAIELHARTALRAAFLIGTAKIISCGTLYDTLCSHSCTHCGDFGPYVYLITCKRVCYFCFTIFVPFSPLKPQVACKMFGLDRGQLQSLPQMTSWPGLYTHREEDVKSRVLIDFEAAKAAGLALYGSPVALRDYITAFENEYILRCQLEWMNRVRPPQHSTAYLPNNHDGDTFRFLAIASLPWLNTATRTAEVGRYCRGCYGIYPWRATLSRHRFTAVAFLDHIEKYGEIIDNRHVKFVDIGVYQPISPDDTDEEDIES